jgi:hypothetical protein
LKVKEPTPAGGCLRWEKEFAPKLKDLFKHKKNITNKDIELLKIGRHFRYKKDKIIVGKNKEENKKLLKLKSKSDYFFEVPKVGSPITILKGKAIKITAQLTAKYSDNKDKIVLVRYGKEKLNKSIKIKQEKTKAIKL